MSTGICSRLAPSEEVEYAGRKLTAFNKLFINGKFVDAVSGKAFETENPSTGEV